MIRSFACGEPLCKETFEHDVDADKPWPIPCPKCGRSLYPDELLQSSAVDDLDKHRGPLMKVSGAKLVPVNRAELATKTRGAVDARSILDEMVEAADAPAAERPKPRLPIVAIVLGLVAAAIVTWLLTRGN